MGSGLELRSFLSQSPPWDNRCITWYPAIGLDEVLWTFFLAGLESWSSQSQPLQVAGITDVSHQCLVPHHVLT
jgi:hypothetical protein